MKLPQLFPQDIRDKLLKLGKTAKQKNPIAHVKFFYPDFHWTWYGIEFDGKDVFYSYVVGDFPEFGTFSLRELMENRGTLGFEIERDLSFAPLPIDEVLTMHSIVNPDDIPY